MATITIPDGPDAWFDRLKKLADQTGIAADRDSLSRSKHDQADRKDSGLFRNEN